MRVAFTVVTGPRSIVANAVPSTRFAVGWGPCALFGDSRPRSQFSTLYPRAQFTPIVVPPSAGSITFDALAYAYAGFSIGVGRGVRTSLAADSALQVRFERLRGVVFSGSAVSNVQAGIVGRRSVAATSTGQSASALSIGRVRSVSFQCAALSGVAFNLGGAAKQVSVGMAGAGVLAMSANSLRRSVATATISAGVATNISRLRGVVFGSGAASVLSANVVGKRGAALSASGVSSVSLSGSALKAARTTAGSASASDFQINVVKGTPGSSGGSFDSSFDASFDTSTDAGSMDFSSADSSSLVTTLF